MEEEITRLRRRLGLLRGNTLTQSQVSEVRDIEERITRLEREIAGGNQGARMHGERDQPRTRSGNRLHQGPGQLLQRQPHQQQQQHHHHQQHQQQQQYQQQQQQQQQRQQQQPQRRQQQEQQRKHPDPIYLQRQQQQQQQQYNHHLQQQQNEKQDHKKREQQQLQSRERSGRSGNGTQRRIQVFQRGHTAAEDPPSHVNRSLTISAVVCRPKSSTTGRRTHGTAVSKPPPVAHAEEIETEGPDFDTVADRVTDLLANGAQKLQIMEQSRRNDREIMQAQLDNIRNTLANARQARLGPEEGNQPAPPANGNVEPLSVSLPRESLGLESHGASSPDCLNNNGRPGDRDNRELGHTGKHDGSSVGGLNLRPDRSPPVNRYPEKKTNQTMSEVPDLSCQESIICNDSVMHSNLQTDPVYTKKNPTGNAGQGRSLDCDKGEEWQQNPTVDQEGLKDWKWSKSLNVEGCPKKLRTPAVEKAMTDSGLNDLSSLSDEDNCVGSEEDSEKMPEEDETAGACGGDGACGGLDLGDDGFEDDYSDEVAFEANLQRLLQ